jgi:hypothetical protein
MVNSRTWRADSSDRTLFRAKPPGLNPQSEDRSWFQAEAQVGRPGPLLTCETITEAGDKNDMRLGGPGAR